MLELTVGTYIIFVVFAAKFTEKSLKRVHPTIEFFMERAYFIVIISWWFLLISAFFEIKSYECYEKDSQNWFFVLSRGLGSVGRLGLSCFVCYFLAIRKGIVVPLVVYAAFGQSAALVITRSDMLYFSLFVQLFVLLILFWFMITESFVQIKGGTYQMFMFFVVFSFADLCVQSLQMDGVSDYTRKLARATLNLSPVLYFFWVHSEFSDRRLEDWDVEDKSFPFLLKRTK